MVVFFCVCVKLRARWHAGGMEVWCLRAWDWPGTTVRASAPFFLLFPPIFLSPFLCSSPLFSSDSSVFSISCSASPPPPLSILCLSSSVSLLGLSHDKKLLRTVMHPGFVFCKCTLLSYLFFSALLPGWKSSVTQALDRTTMLWSAGVHNQGGNMQQQQHC